MKSSKYNNTNSRSLTKANTPKGAAELTAASLQEVTNFYADVTVNKGWKFMGWASLLLCLLYFLTTQPINNSDSVAGSNLALTSALANNHSFSIDHFIGLTGHNALANGFITNPSDYPNLSYFQGHYYSEQPPGVAFLTVPFYQVGHLLAILFGTIFPDTLVGSQLSAALSLLGCAIVGAISVLVTYAASLKLGSGEKAARYAALSLGLSTTLWRASGHYSSPVFSLGLLSLALLLAFPPLPRDLANPNKQESFILSWKRGLVLGLVLGLAVTVDYSNLVWTPLFGIYLLVKGRSSFKQVSSWAGPILGWLIGVMPLLVYNTLIFARPWAFTYGFAIGDTSANSLVTRYLKGFDLSSLPSALFGGGRSMLGPFLIFFGVWGLVALFGQRGKRKEASLLASLIIAVLVFGLLRHAVGQDNTRADFLIAILPPLTLSTAVWYERFQFLTRLEQSWVPYLATFGLAFYYFISAPGPFIANLSALVYLIPLVPIAGLILVAWQLLPKVTYQRKFAAIALSAVIIMGLVTFLLGENTTAFAITVDRYGNNLLFNPGVTAGTKSNNYEGWEVTGKATTASNGTGIILEGDATLKPFLASVQGGKSYNLSINAASTGSATLEVLWSWSDEGHLPLGEYRQVYNLNKFKVWSDNRAAPPAAAYLQLSFHQINGQIRYTNFALLDDSVRIEPMQNFATAALSFSFDWESAMGGLIHSRGGGSFLETGEPGSLNINSTDTSAAFNYATQRGLAMRQGADNLLNFFNQYNIRGTFYATGYNLIDGNTEHKNFVNNTDPVYKNYSAENGWANDYWVTHPWYNFDPYTTYKDPVGKAWYFGDQTQQLAKSNQDIEPHTFGHLFVRNIITPAQFASDMQTWLSTAKSDGLPAPTTFAFPWKASNSTDEPYYKFLADNGFTAVTRLYDLQQNIKEDYSTGTLSFPDAKGKLHSTPTDDNFYYYLDRVHYNNRVLEPRLLALHDYELRQGDKSEQTARTLINQLMERRGYGSIWTHPEEVVQPDQMQQWERTIAYAASLRDSGLWVDSVKNIIQHRLDVQKISLETEVTSNPHTIVLTITNHNDHNVINTTYTVPGTIKDIRFLVSGVDITKNGSQFNIQRLEPNESVTLAIDL